MLKSSQTSWGQQAATRGSFWRLGLEWHSRCSGLFLVQSILWLSPMGTCSPVDDNRRLITLLSCPWTRQILTADFHSQTLFQVDLTREHIEWKYLTVPSALHLSNSWWILQAGCREWQPMWQCFGLNTVSVWVKAYWYLLKCHGWPLKRWKVTQYIMEMNSILSIFTSAFHLWRGGSLLTLSCAHSIFTLKNDDDSRGSLQPC